MRSFFKYRAIVFVVILVVLGGIGLFAYLSKEKVVDEDQVEEQNMSQDIIGSSVEGRDIDVYTYGSSDASTKILFVGGVHGGYEWNTVSLAYSFVDYLKEHADFVPKGVQVSIIPSANPDGLYRVVRSGNRFDISSVPREEETVPGRFNAHDVDLNRNFDCKWKPESMWRGNVVSAGTSAFSEPEAIVLRDFISEYRPDAVIFWHSQGNSVYASECEDGILPETLSLMNAYAGASGYTAVESFDAYEITGDAEGWLASIGIPALTVELATHETVELEENLRGVRSLFEYYRKE